jgi:hypothetical protein
VRRLKPLRQFSGCKFVGGYGPAIWRSYGASRNLGTDIYKDFAPTERDSRSPKSPDSNDEIPTAQRDSNKVSHRFSCRLKVTISVLVAVCGLFCSSGDGATEAQEKPAVVKDQPLDIRVQANAFGKASAADITVALRSAGEELFRYCPHTQLDGIDVYYRADHPQIDLHRTREGRIAIGLSARDTRWAQYSFQFAHEFCHALANFADHSQPAVSKVPNPNLWLEESLCETASLFVLRAMSRTWATHPPYPEWQVYAPWLNDYVEQRLALPENRLPVSFSAWFCENQTALRRDPEQRARNIIIATHLLPIFEADPVGWEAVTFLNRKPSDPAEALAKRFAEWRANCPGHLRSFVTKIAALFGISLR